MSGRGRMAASGGVASLMVSLPDMGPIKLLSAGSLAGRYIELPASLAQSLGERSSVWLRYTPVLQRALPARVRSGLSFVALAGWSIDALRSFRADRPSTAAAARH